ncbi:MAG: gephyrin-like molybdotransferase Glp [Pseudomonadota bacterium]
MSTFDTVMMVDWSAGKAKPKKPTKDAIWVGVCRQGRSDEPKYLRSRIEAEQWLSETLSAESTAGRRTLVGFDFPFGYPVGFGRKLTGSDDPFVLWSWIEQRITDDASGTNNRFEVAEMINALFPSPGPFWGKHNQAEYGGIPYRKLNGVVFDGFDEHRACEQTSKAPSSCFQLAFPPTVGGQVLMGLPVLWRLRQSLGAKVWPFEAIDDAPLVFAEVWPGLIEDAVPKDKARIRDEDQVRLLAEAFAGQSATSLAAMFNVPEIAKTEAWILGAAASEKLLESLQKPLTPPRLKNDCFALPAGVDWTPVDDALARLKERLTRTVGQEPVQALHAAGHVLASDVTALRSNPPAANAAVDGYGFAHATLSLGDQVLPLVSGRAAAGAPFTGAVPHGHAIRILTGALLPPGVDTVVLEEDVSTDGRRIAFDGEVKAGANTRNAGEDVEAGDIALKAGSRLGPPELALLAAVGVTEVPVFKPLRVGVLSTGDELASPGDTLEPDRTYDANRPMLLSLINEWRMTPVDLGHVPDDRTRLRARLSDAARQCDAILTSGGASAGDEDHVSALLGETGSRSDWRIALKPGRPLALGVWEGVPIFGLPGNPVAALVCTLIFARPAFAVLGGEEWHAPQGFMVPAAFHKKKKPGRREYLRARMQADGTVETFRSEGSGRISGLSWADGLVELADGAAEIGPGDLVRYIPYASFR